MEVLPTIIPISDIRQRQHEILEQVASQTIVFTQHGKGVAVMMSIEKWNRIAEELEDLRDVLMVYRQDRAIAAGDLELEDVDTDALREWVERGKVAASG